MFDSPWFMLLLYISCLIGLALALNRWLPRGVYRDDSGIDPKAMDAIELALVHWRQTRRRDDAHWEAAFGALGKAFECAAYLDIRLYMYSHSNEAGEFFRRYESYIFD